MIRPPSRLLLVAGLHACLACRAGGPTSSARGGARGEPGASGGAGQLARVRPPAPPCEVNPPSPRAYAEAAARAYDAEEDGKALACAEAALELAPRHLAALRLRATALVALDRAEEARLAWSLALAVDPDDPLALRGAADLYVLRLSGARDELALGREYALRGARRAERPPRRDRALAAELWVLAAMADNDLGDSREALAHADAALRRGADEADARYERGVALYELCRFEEAEAALTRVLALVPDDAWAHHQLALVAERRGDLRRAEALEARARQLAPDTFPAEVPLDPTAFQAEVRAAVASLPSEERRALDAVPVEVEDVPSLEDLTAVDPPLSPSILGLYRGPPERERCLPEDGPRCRSIVVYRRNLERFARDRRELEEQVKVTLLHELGHLHGESDDQLRARGLE